MKFSWKICFSTMLISVVVFSIGGFFLISSLFQSTFQREAESALEENRMLRYAFVAYWNTTVPTFDIHEESVQEAVNVMQEGMKGSDVRFRITHPDYKSPLYDNTEAKEDKELLTMVDADKDGYLRRRTKDGYELQVAGAISTIGDEVIYVETIRDITVIYKERNQQYRIYLKWLAGVLIIEAICGYIITKWLLKPLKRLSEITGRIAQGQLGERAKIDSRDEIGELAKDFNDMAEHLEKQFQELEDVARRQEDFIGSFAHELKTPLTSMIGYADMLRTQRMTEEEQHQAANYIFKEGKRLETLSLKLLDLLVVRHQELERKEVSIKWLAEEIGAILKSIIRNEDISFEIDVKDAMLLLEPDLIKTVLLNLLDNGRKAIEGKGILRLSGREDQNGYRIYVEDNGKGIPEEELARITEAFYMVDKSRARKQGGAGLGLSICKEIIQRHGGDLEFESKENIGTKVCIFLPKEVTGR